MQSDVQLLPISLRHWPICSYQFLLYSFHWV